VKSGRSIERIPVKTSDVLNIGSLEEKPGTKPISNLKNHAFLIQNAVAN
jgi:hypothetical protein